MKKILFSILLILLSFSVSSQASNQTIMNITDIKGITYQVTGTTEGFRIKGLEGKIIFLEFFGHRCPPCLRSIPHLIKLQEKYKDKLAIISIEVQGLNNTQLQHFSKQKGMNYIVATNEKAASFTNYVSQRAQWRGSIPFMVALDKKGNVQFIQAGMLPEASLEELIRQLDALK